MKITYFYRKKNKGVFSIEEVFKLVRSCLKTRIDDRDFFVSGEDHMVKSILKAKKAQSDINHITGAVNYLALGLKAKRTVITIHDIGHYEKTLSGIKKRVYKYLYMLWPMKRAGMITTISEFTKSRILEHFHINPEKIKVIHNPAPMDFSPKPKEFSPIPRILQIGSGHNKNISSLIAAVKNIDCRLILIRKPEADLIETLKENNIEHEFHYNLERSDVLKLYQSSDILYFASTYEGFGVPILEANATGIPVVTSNVASMPEIAGNAAAIVDPLNVHEIEAAIKKIMDDKAYRQILISNGFQNLDRFLPEKIADDYFNLYKKILV